jgi:16S rRNA (cytosine967-C5)-methyltransferase
MQKASLFQSAVELLDSILGGTVPADVRMEQYFRAHPRFGVRDRGFVAETVYACLRQRRSLGFLASGTDSLSVTAAQLVATLLVSREGWSGRALDEAGFQGNGNALIERVRNTDLQSLPAAVRADLPDWLYSRLVTQFGEAEALALSAALNEPARPASPRPATRPNRRRIRPPASAAWNAHRSSRQAVSRKD